jgi:hypothetical protein
MTFTDAAGRRWPLHMAVRFVMEDVDCEPGCGHTEESWRYSKVSPEDAAKLRRADELAAETLRQLREQGLITADNEVLAVTTATARALEAAGVIPKPWTDPLPAGIAAEE